MKKGNVWPRARTRWLTTDEEFQRNQPPVWAEVFEFGAIIIVAGDPIPIPIFVNEGDCSLGQYSYNPNTGTAIWHGTWTILTLSGDWYFRQHNNGTEFPDLSFSIVHNNGLIDHVLTLDAVPNIWHGLWSLSDNYTIYGDHISHIDFPWAFASHIIMKPATYAQLRSLGIDPDDTRPVTWNSPL